MDQVTCLVCCSVNSRNFEILDTRLQAVYEKVTDLKVQKKLLLCYVCSRRLQQCYEMQQLAKQTQKRLTRYQDNSNEEYFFIPTQNRTKSKCQGPLVKLSVGKAAAMSIPSEWSVAEERTVDPQRAADASHVPAVTLRVDGIETLDVKEEDATDRDDMEQEDLEDPLEQDGDKSKESSEDQSADSDVDSKQEGHKTEDSDSGPTSDFVELKVSKNSITIYACHVCSFETRRESSFNNHLRIHSTTNIAGDKSYSCDICKQPFPDRISVAAHKLTHTFEKPYSCDICDRTFSERCNLNVHRRTHTGDKPFTCDVCNRPFSRSSHLTQHMRTHTGDRPYTCDVCKRTFSQRSHLSRHRRTHTGDKPYNCDICERTFSRSSHLIQHRRTHTGDKPYVCDVCKRCFSNSSALKRHKRTHTGDKPYCCETCKRAFSDGSTLIRHRKTHTAERQDPLIYVNDHFLNQLIF